MYMRTIIFVPYDDKWPEMFEAESLLIKTLLGGVAKSIQHIGSTSVPGLSAKPLMKYLRPEIPFSPRATYPARVIA